MGRDVIFGKSGVGGCTRLRRLTSAVQRRERVRVQLQRGRKGVHLLVHVAAMMRAKPCRVQALEGFDDFHGRR